MTIAIPSTPLPQSVNSYAMLSPSGEPGFMLNIGSQAPVWMSEDAALNLADYFQSNAPSFRPSDSEQVYASSEQSGQAMQDDQSTAERQTVSA